MNKYVLIAFTVLALSTSCGKKKPPVEDYRSFLKAEAPTVNLSSEMLFNMMLYGSVAAYDDDLVVFGMNNLSRVYGYRLSTDSLTLIDASDYGRSNSTVLSIADTDAIWYVFHALGNDGMRKGALGNLTTGEAFYQKSNQPSFGEHSIILANKCLYAVNGRFYTELLSTDTTLKLSTLEDNSDFNHRPKIAKWHIEDDSLVMDWTLCQYPSDYAATEYVDFLPNVSYNPVDSLFILAGKDSRVWLFDLEGGALGEKHLGSQLEKPTAPLPITKGSYNNVLDWYAHNNHYGTIIFDRYRNVYLRALTIPPIADEDALERSDENTWVLVVADRDFRVKYEVLFDDHQYEWRLILPTREGVYIAKKKGDKYEKPSLFVFD